MCVRACVRGGRGPAGWCPCSPPSPHLIQMVMIGLYNGGSMVTERSLAQLTTSRFPCVVKGCPARMACRRRPLQPSLIIAPLALALPFSCGRPVRVLTLSGSERKSKMWQWAVNDETYGVGPLFILGRPMGRRATASEGDGVRGRRRPRPRPCSVSPTTQPSSARVVCTILKPRPSHPTPPSSSQATWY